MTNAIQVRNLNKEFKSGGLFAKRSSVHAVKDVSFDVRDGSTMGLIGESGSGKSTTARMVCRLLTPDSGSIELFGKDIVKLSRREAKQVTRDVQIVFQDPGSSLNPRWRIGSLIAEGMAVHGLGSTAKKRADRVSELLAMCGLPKTAAEKFPHEFSGGQRQRIAIARALAVEPRVLILDEPVSALDVSIQAQILTLLQELQKELGVTYLMVSHDIAVVEQFCDDVCVMRHGEMVEQGEVSAVMNNPQDEYTKQLINAHPEPDPRSPRTLV